MRKARQAMQALYRFYDSNDVLLYVGISNNWIQRLRSHEKQSPFFALASRVTIEHYETRKSVEQAEVQAIHHENPVFNKKDSIQDESWQAHLRLLLDMATGRIKPDDRHRRMFETESRRPIIFESQEFIADFRNLWWYANNYLVYRPRMICDTCDSLAINPIMRLWQDRLNVVMV